MAVSSAEATFIEHHRALFSGDLPVDPAFDFVGLSAEGQAVFGEGLSGVALRFLLEQGGTLGDLAFIDGQRRRDYHFFDAPLKFHFSQRLYELLKQRYLTDTLPDPEGKAYTSADEVILLALAARESIDAPQERRALLGHGTLPRLFFGAGHFVEAQPLDLARSAEVCAILFALRPLLAKAWLSAERTCMGKPRRPEQLLRFAELRHACWTAYYELATRTGQLHLLQPFCELYRQLFGQRGYPRAVISVLDRSFRFEFESDRQRVYRKMLSAYQWLADLNALCERATITSQYDDDYTKMRVFLASFSGIGADPRSRAGRLLGHLRFEVDAMQASEESN